MNRDKVPELWFEPEDESEESCPADDYDPPPLTRVELTAQDIRDGYISKAAAARALELARGGR